MYKVVCLYTEKYTSNKTTYMIFIFKIVFLLLSWGSTVYIRQRGGGSTPTAASHRSPCCVITLQNRGTAPRCRGAMWKRTYKRMGDCILWHRSVDGAGTAALSYVNSLSVAFDMDNLCYYFKNKVFNLFTTLMESKKLKCKNLKDNHK